MLQLVFRLYGFCHATQLACRLANVSTELGDKEIAMQEKEMGNAGTDGIGWTERVACWQTVNWPEQKIVREFEGRMWSGNWLCVGL